MKKFRYSIVFILFTTVLTATLMAQRPPKALVGITVGGMYLPGGTGYMLTRTNNQPARTWGWVAGLSLYRRMNKDLHFTGDLLLMEEQSYVQGESATTTIPDARGFGPGQISKVGFPYRALHLRFLLNHQGAHLGRKDWVLKEFAGFAFNYGNLLEEGASITVDDVQTRAIRTQRVQFDPEFVIGAGMVSKMTAFGAIHYSLSLHLDIFDNQIYTAEAENLLIRSPLQASAQQRDINIMFTATYFLRFPPKQNSCYRF